MKYKHYWQNYVALSINKISDCKEKFEYLNSVYNKLLSSQKLIEIENDHLRLD